jgi:hypothetical protein
MLQRISGSGVTTRCVRIAYHASTTEDMVRIAVQRLIEPVKQWTLDAFRHGSGTTAIDRKLRTTNGRLRTIRDPFSTIVGFVEIGVPPRLTRNDDAST